MKQNILKEVPKLTLVRSFTHNFLSTDDSGVIPIELESKLEGFPTTGHTPNLGER